MSRPIKRKHAGKYDPALKIAIAREYLTSDLGYKALSVKYNVSATSVRDFVKWYKEKYPDGIVEEVGITEGSIKPQDEPGLKITALEMLIEKASKELGIDLVKKFGTKQQKK